MMRRIDHQFLRTRAGFTLIELLVVISIIMVAASIVFVAGRGGSGAALSSGTRIVSSIAQGARGQAILNSSEAAIIIYANQDLNSHSTADPDKFLRFFGILVRDDPASNEWRAVTQGTYLPRGVYFNPTLAEERSSGSWSVSEQINIDFPLEGAQPIGGSDTYYIFRFSPNGRTLNPNAWIVLQAGVLRSVDGGPLRVDLSRDEDEFLLSALILRPAGTTTTVTDPSAVRNAP